MKQTTAMNVADATVATSMFWQNAADPVEYKIVLGIEWKVLETRNDIYSR